MSKKDEARDEISKILNGTIGSMSIEEYLEMIENLRDDLEMRIEAARIDLKQQEREDAKF